MLSLAESRWQAPSARACAVREAFAEVQRTTGRRWMRRMRADHYGVLRAARGGARLGVVREDRDQVGEALLRRVASSATSSVWRV